MDSKGHKIILILTALLSVATIESYNYPSAPSRRKVLQQVTKGGVSIFASTFPLNTPQFFPRINNIANAASTTTSSSANEEIQILQDASSALTSLLTNWDKATIDCTYADVPRELLEQKNKEQLLEKASTFALFDKSTSVVSCKKSNKVVRDYIGVTGKGPMVGIEKRILKRTLVNEVDPDDLEKYIEYSEEFSQSLSKASSLSYMAGVADFDSVNTFEKGSEADLQNGQGNSNLDQTKRAIGDVQTYLGKLISLLTSDSDSA